jgi:hypothetical protein
VAKVAPARAGVTMTERAERYRRTAFDESII